MYTLLSFRRIIDLRTSQEILKFGKIPNSLNINFECIKNDYLHYIHRYDINKHDMYLFYCSSGKRSSLITWLLRSKGYNAINLDLGYNFFKKNNYKFYVISNS